MAVFISMTFSLQGQSGLNNPLGNSVIQYESNPIDLATGLPYVSVPLFKMPTIADDIIINMALSYHPSSVAVNSVFSGNCGRGWTLGMGGTVVGEYSYQRKSWQDLSNSGGRAYFNYSFMGYSGKFYIEKWSNKLQGYITEKNDNVLLIDIDHHPTTYRINSITLHDHKGYKYEFQTADYYTATMSGVSSLENYLFQLTTVRDNNNALLATFNYKTYGAGTPTINNMVQSIVTHHGKVELENSLGPSITYHPSVKYTKMTVSDFRNNFIRRFDFTYQDEKLIQVDEGDLLQTNLLSHKFYYKPGLLFVGEAGVDEWGYRNSNFAGCPTLTNVTPSSVANGVLQKISLPSGGAIIYDFESNDYSYSMTKPIDQNGSFVTDPLYFTTLSHKNLHNFQTQSIASGGFTTGSSISFTLTATKIVYIKLIGQPYAKPLDLSPNGATVMVYPTFTLRKNGVVVTSNMNVSSSCDNGGMGLSSNLSAGSYTLTMNASKPTTGSATLVSYVPISDTKKWHYGNGIRIRKIGYFESDAVGQRYYDLGNTSFTPVKETSYDYRLVGEPLRSSGCIFYVNAYSEEKPTLIYKNVTVTESGNMGRTEYTFYSPLDYYQLADFDGQEPNFSKIKQMKVLDQNGTLLQEKSFTFNAVTVGTHNTDERFQLNFRLNSSQPAEIRQKDYLNGTVETISTFDYDSYRKLANSKQFISSTGDFILKKYFYHWLNSATSKNRRVLEKIETYRNTDLLFTDRISYGNTWTTIAEPGALAGTTLFPAYPNVSYLPLSQQGAKGTDNLFTGQRFNLYDGYSRLWESETDSGIKTVYIWGYKHTQIVAKIDNIAYNTLPQSLIHAIVRASDTGTEAELITAQNNLRANALLANAMITTFTYKPLIGISTVTDEKKQTIQYFYDMHNRLKQVKDHTGKLLTENEYNYRTQN